MADNELEIEIRETVRERVDGGFSPRATMAEDVFDYFSDEREEDELEPFVGRIIAEEFARHAAEQTVWDGLTDCDRLDQAFAILEREGVVARQNFACCGNCGVAEIGEEDPERTSIGYVFYHSQDTERAVTGGSLFFNYGADDEESSLAIGWRLMSALQNAGLTPQWSGELSQRVFVPMNWKKRRSDH